MDTKIIFPRKSVFKAFAGVVIAFGTVAFIVFDAFDYRSLGILGIVPIMIGAMLTKEFFREA